MIESSLIAEASLMEAFEIILVLAAIIANRCMKGNAATGCDWR
jgi:hypothetical protein